MSLPTGSPEFDFLQGTRALVEELSEDGHAHSRTILPWIACFVTTSKTFASGITFNITTAVVAPPGNKWNQDRHGNQSGQ